MGSQAIVDISVWITTYNHEQFIAEAIESVLMQQTTFTYEIIIGEDCSTDGTRAIVQHYQRQYSDKIRLFLPAVNLGMIPMTKASYALCTGRYVAWLDGDDYWTDPSKLQKQVDFLENNPTFSFCFHRVLLLNQLQNEAHELEDSAYKGSSDNTLTTKDFINISNPVYALSVVHRNVLGNPLPNWLWVLPYPDWGLYLALSEHGSAKYFDQSMGVYRIHKSGAYSGQTVTYNYKNIIMFFIGLKKFSNFGNEFGAAIDDVVLYYREGIIKENKVWLKNSLKRFKLREAAKYAFLLLFKS
jgi:glycosyltransferase involved in cell wall biosynthesis